MSCDDVLVAFGPLTDVLTVDRADVGAADRRGSDLYHHLGVIRPEHLYLFEGSGAVTR